jgi:hypothetical protein
MQHHQPQIFTLLSYVIERAKFKSCAGGQCAMPSWWSINLAVEHF